MKKMLLLLFLLSIMAFCQQNNKKEIFKKYDGIDTSFIENIEPNSDINTKNWVRHICNEQKLEFYYPPEFRIENKFFPSYCDSTIWIGSYNKDTLFFNYVSISFFSGNLQEALQYSVFQESKLKSEFIRDSLGSVVDSGKTYWIMYGHQGMIEEADIIKSDNWIGLEAWNTKGVYSEQGYLGLTMSLNIFLFYKRGNNCSIIVEYTDRPYFYDEEIDNTRNEPEYFLNEDTFFQIADLISQNN